MKITKTKINERKKRKTDNILVRTIELAKKANQLELAKKLSGPTKLQKKVNLYELDKTDGGQLLIPGKVLSSGEINKKCSIAALNYSEKAREKLKNAGCNIKSIEQELKENPELKGVRVI